MNGVQIVVGVFALLVAALSIWSVIVVARSSAFKLKPLWIVGCLTGFVGLGTDWTVPDTVIVLFGVIVPVVWVFTVVATGQVIVKTGFPIVSVIALIKARNASVRLSTADN